jgi:hypothetical protein
VGYNISCIIETNLEINEFRKKKLGTFWYNLTLLFEWRSILYAINPTSKDLTAYIIEEVLNIKFKFRSIN